MQNFKGKVIWITGASAGIGKEMAIQSAEKGAFVILSARNEGALHDVASALPYPEMAFVLPMDMLKTQEFDTLIEKAIGKWGRIDLLFNNAGISQRSLARETTEEVDRQLMEVNYYGPMLLTKKLLPFLREQGGAHLAVTSSLAGKFGFYLRSAYSASKFAVNGFFETLALEEVENNIHVTILCPSGVKTDISKNALDGKGAKFGKQSALQEDGISVQACVKMMIEGIQKNKKEVIIGNTTERLSVKIKALFPALFFRLLQKKKPY